MTKFSAVKYSNETETKIYYFPNWDLIGEKGNLLGRLPLVFAIYAIIPLKGITRSTTREILKMPEMQSDNSRQIQYHVLQNQDEACQVVHDVVLFH